MIYGYGYGAVKTITKVSGISKPVKFISNLFRRSRYAKWYGKGFERLIQVLKDWDRSHPGDPAGLSLFPPYVRKTLKYQAITAKEKNLCLKWIGVRLTGWNKGMRKNIIDHFNSIVPIPEPKPKPPVVVHKVSASYKPEAKTQTITKARDIRNAMPPSLAQISAIPKIPLYILIGAGAVLLIFKLAKAKGGAV